MNVSCVGAVLCALTSLTPVPVRAAVRFVSSTCPTSGSGAQANCGASGPFRTIGEGIRAMQPGDTLNIRSGVYFEQMTLRNNSTQPGRALACTTAAPCVIQGCRAPACPTNEVPTVRGMRTRADWTATSGGVYWRTMELSPEIASSGDQNNTRAGDPLMVMQGTAHPFGMMPYAGDNVTAPPDGRWSFHPATRRLYVNPTGSADPATVVQIPHFSYVLLAHAPTANVTVQHLNLEGARLVGAQWTGTPPGLPGIRMRNLNVRYFPRQGIRTTNGAPGVLLEDVLVEYGCRGISWALSTGDGCFGLRLFGVHGGTVRRATVRHLGSAGRRRLSAPQDPDGWPCSWCDSPWNTVQSTEISTSGVGINVKQTNGATVEDSRIEDVSFGGVFVDVSRNVNVRRTATFRTASGLSQNNFTPTTGYTVSYDNLFEANRIERADQCGITVMHAETPGRPAGSLIATIERNTLIAARTAICVPTPTPAAIIVRNNTVTTTSGGTSPLTTTTTIGGSGTVTSTTFQTTSTTGPSTSSTLSSTSTTSPDEPGPTTTTTLAPEGVHLLDGAKLRLDSRPGEPSARKLSLRSKDRERLVLDDPTAVLSGGGELRIVGVGGDWFESTHPLPATGWSLLDMDDPQAGLVYRAPDEPISRLTFAAGRMLRITGEGALLPYTLATEPDLVQIELRLGAHRYCLEFGGAMQKFIPEQSLLRRKAPRALGCPID
jgi:hypothetical protein